MKPFIVPFGRYKDQPVENLSQDKDYLDWLLAQNWFAEKYKDLHTIIINNFQEPTDTPEHNALQAMFLDERFCDFFVKYVLDNSIDTIRQIEEWNEKHGWSPSELYRLRGKNIIDYKRNRISFEKEGIDVVLSYTLTQLNPVSTWNPTEEKMEFRIILNIEIKPSVGDDYPSVLRQMQSMKSNVLFIEDYTGKGIYEDQFVKIFENQKICVVFRRKFYNYDEE